MEWSNYWALNKRKRRMNERSSWYLLSLLECLESSRSVKLHYISLYTGFDRLRMCYLTMPNSWRMKWLGYASMRLKGRHHHPSHIIYTISILAIGLPIPSACTVIYSPWAVYVRRLSEVSYSESIDDTHREPVEPPFPLWLDLTFSDFLKSSWKHLQIRDSGGLCPFSYKEWY